jgi:hypothetical protein
MKEVIRDRHVRHHFSHGGPVAGARNRSRLGRQCQRIASPQVRERERLAPARLAADHADVLKL